MAIGDTWAITANGGRAKIVRNLGAKNSERVECFETEHPRAGELNSDRAGREFSSAGKNRSAIEQHSDPVRNNEKLFARDLSDYLLKHFSNKAYGSLVVTCAPRTLGDLRSAFSPQLAGSITVELDKDFTQLSDHELPAKLLSLTKT